MSNLTKLKKLAKAISVLTNNIGVKVTVSGKDAYSCGGTINIPQGNFSDSNYMKMCQGYIDHELGHETYTEHRFFSLARRQKQGNLLVSILNALEDARMEKLVMNKYPGAKINLENVWNLLIDGNDIPNPTFSKDISNIVFSYILNKSREFICGHSKTYTQLGFEALTQSFSRQFADQLTLLIEKLQHCTSTKLVYDLSIEILQFINDNCEEPDDTGNGSGDDADSNDTGNGSGDDADLNDTGNGSKGAKSVLINMEEEYDYHKQLQKMLKTSAVEQNDNDHNGFAIKTADVSHYTSPKCIAQGWKSLSSKFTRTLQRVMIDNSDSLTMSACTGSKLITRKLASVPTGNGDIFEYKEESELQTSSVMLLVDASGSMNCENDNGTSNMQEANKTALAFAKAFTRMGIDIEVNYFGVNISSDNHIYTAKKFNQKLKPERFGLPPSGTTPTHNGLYYSLLRILNQPSDNKIIFLITDGQPDESSLLNVIIQDIQKTNVRLVTIGLGTKSVYGINDAVYAKNANCVNDALKSAIKNKLF